MPSSGTGLHLNDWIFWICSKSINVCYKNIRRGILIAFEFINTNKNKELFLKVGRVFT